MGNLLIVTISIPVRVDDGVTDGGEILRVAVAQMAKDYLSEDGDVESLTDGCGWETSARRAPEKEKQWEQLGLWGDPVPYDPVVSDGIAKGMSRAIDEFYLRGEQT